MIFLDKIINNRLLNNSKVIFIIVGSCATLVHLLIVVSLVQLTSLSPLSTNIIGFLCAWFVSYFGHYHLSFKAKSSHLSAMPKFILVSASVFILNQTLYFILLKYTNLNYAIALFLVLLIVAVTSYLLSKLWAFT